VTPPRTAVQKIFDRASGTLTETGASAVVRPDYILAYDFPGWADRMIETLTRDHGIEQLPDPERYVVFIDHLLTRGDETEAAAHRTVREWGERNGVAVYEDRGIGHQLTAEQGYVAPGRLLVHFDAHISSAGALGALGFGLHRQILDAWVTGQVALEVPATARVELRGTSAPGVDARDLLHHLIARVGAGGYIGQVIEFTGDGAARLPIDQRQGLCGMAMFSGAVSAIFTPDDLMIEYADAHARGDYTPVDSDPGCTYSSSLEISLAELEPHIVAPGSSRPSNTTTIGDVVGTAIDRGFIGSCASGRLEDLHAAAQVLRGKHVKPGFRLIVVPTTVHIREMAERDGTLDVLRDAGADIGKPTCDHCFGYADPLQAGETCISTGVLNVRGRMGSIDAQIYMASAATVAATALSGRISDPREQL
jgi:3-isopropylmalate/(R)-2-methylmalate dehydratase large subunit